MMYNRLSAVVFFRLFLIRFAPVELCGETGFRHRNFFEFVLAIIMQDQQKTELTFLKKEI